MSQNIIYYGPPGTGKTYFMQKQIEEYTDYLIKDKDIENSYILKSDDWILIALVIMQNNEPMSSSDIFKKISTLSLGYKGLPSDVLELHSINDSKLNVTRAMPRIFFEVNGKWYVERMKVLEYDPNFMLKYMKNSTIEKRYAFVTFHQSFVYEDFVEGIRPVIDKSTKALGYEVQEGIFKRICETAKNNPHKEYALFIDEINRGNISEIFGELISLIELDKRLGKYCELTAILPYSKKPFGVPSNLSIIGTMNSSDKSIANIDIALRRRFDFVNIACDYSELAKAINMRGINPNDVNGIDVIKLLTVINKRLELLLDYNYIIGHAFFINVTTFEDIKDIIIRKIVPLLEEYFYDDLQKVQMVLSDIDIDGNLVAEAIYLHEELEVSNLFNYVGDYILETKRVYSINKDFTEMAVIKIYNGVKL